MAHMIRLTETYNQFNCFSGKTINEAIKWFQDLRDNLPAEVRDSAMVELDNHRDYDNYYAHIEIYYYRPETKEEATARAICVAEQEDHQRAVDLKKLEELRAKYGV